MQIKEINLVTVRARKGKETFEVPDEIKTTTDAKRLIDIVYKKKEIDPSIREAAFVVTLNRYNHPTGLFTCSIGTGTECNIDNKLVVKACLDTQASGIILFHNHPSGEPSPSASDIKTTKALKKALHLFDILLCDHIIITPDPKKWYSFHEGKKVTT